MRSKRTRRPNARSPLLKKSWRTARRGRASSRRRSKTTAGRCSASLLTFKPTFPSRPRSWRRRLFSSNNTSRSACRSNRLRLQEQLPKARRYRRIRRRHLRWRDRSKRNATQKSRSSHRKKSREMGVYEARGTLGKALKQLMLSWSEAKLGWDDPVAHALEANFLVPLEMDLKNAIGAMDHSGAVLAQARRDCDD